MTRYWAGIDPGLHGWAAAISESRDIPPLIHRLCGEVSRSVDACGLQNWLDHVPQLAGVVVERQQAMPKQGVSSAFTCGAGYGRILAVLELWECHSWVEVSPSVWKRRMGLLAPASKRDRKLLATERAAQLVGREALIPPEGRVPSHDLAEAVLLAEYGRIFNDR